MNNRYSRQISFKPIGKHGQQLIKKSVVTIIGCGALGTVCSELLVRAGIGEIYLADRDYVEYSNLQRQQLFTEQDAKDAIPKVIAAKRRLQLIQSHVKIESYFQHVDATLMENLAKKSTLLIDATDNFETRLLINDAAFKYDIPWIYGACIGSSGVVFPFVPGKTPCIRCMLQTIPRLNDTCESAGIISPAVQVTAAMQTSEALKLLTNNHSKVMSEIYHFDLWDNIRLNLGVSMIKNDSCESCSIDATYPSLTADNHGHISLLCGGETIQILPDEKRTITLKDAERVATRIEAAFKKTPYFIQFWFNDYRIVVFHDGRILIHGSINVALGRKLYIRLFG